MAFRENTETFCTFFDAPYDTFILKEFLTRSSL